MVIVGGGFGGLYAAQSLGCAPLSVTLIDRRNYHLFQPLLYQVATAGLSAPEIAQPIRAILSDRLDVNVLLEEVKGFDLAGKRVLLPRAAVARDILPRKLRERGACVDVVEAYRSVAPAGLAKQAGEVFSGGRRPDWVTFTSSSTVQNFVRVASRDVLSGVKVSSIGPVTSATAKKLGLQISVEAKVFTSDGLVAAILEIESRPHNLP